MSSSDTDMDELAIQDFRRVIYEHIGRISGSDMYSNLRVLRVYNPMAG